MSYFGVNMDKYPEKYLNIHKIFEFIKKDFQLSFKSEKGLNLENYQRISSKLTVLHRFITAPVLIIFFIRMLFPSITSIFSQSFLPSERWEIALQLILPILFIVFLFYFICLRLLIVKHVFFDKQNNCLLIFFPYKNRILSVDSDHLSSIRGTTLSRTDFVTLIVREKEKEIKYNFLGKWRFLRLYMEHPIVREIENSMR